MFNINIGTHRSVCVLCCAGWAESGDEMMLDKCAEELRTAIREMGRITGKIGAEDILDVVFRDFCIGK